MEDIKTMIIEPLKEIIKNVDEIVYIDFSFIENADESILEIAEIKQVFDELNQLYSKLK